MARNDARGSKRSLPKKVKEVEVEVEVDYLALDAGDLDDLIWAVGVAFPLQDAPVIRERLRRKLMVMEGKL